MKTKKVIKSILNNIKAFTLIELLVVVLIIGILAAIAVPQYQISVGKSKYSTIKNLATSLGNAAEAYHLANGHYPASISELDISLPSNVSEGWGIDSKGQNSCILFGGRDNVDQNAAVCFTQINNNLIAYYYFLEYDYHTDGRTQTCYAFSPDRDHIVNKICQQETGKAGSCGSAYCEYNY